MKIGLVEKINSIIRLIRLKVCHKPKRLSIVKNFDFYDFYDFDEEEKEQHKIELSYLNNLIFDNYINREGLQ